MENKQTVPPFSPMTYGSVCSGIEAATVAWHPLGWKPAFFSEIDAFPRAVLQHHYPEVPLHGDFTTIERGQYAAINLLVGGTPCQDFSIAGLRAGLDGDRGNLSLEFLRLADRLRPRWLVWENVPGVFSANEGRAFGAIIGALAELGYGFGWRVLDAQYFGVPQRRRRVFVVGCFGNANAAAAVLFERASMSGHPTPRRQAGERTSLCVTARFKSGRNDPTAETYIAHGLSLASDVIHAKELAQPITQRNGDPGVVAFTCKDYGADAGEIAPTLRAMEHNGSTPNGGGQRQCVAFNLRGREGGSQPEVDCDGLANIRAASGGSSRTYVASSAVRRLTPRECERLQGFPDDYTAVPYRNKPAADGPRYRALGNSMAVPVMRWIGERIAMVEQIIAKESAA